jgi:hypothetical protein
MRIIIPSVFLGIVFMVVIGGCGTNVPGTAGDSNIIGDRDDVESIIDRQEDALSIIPKFLNAPVCTGGRLRCLSHVRLESSGKIQSMAAAATPSGLGPSDLISAYKLDTTINPNATVAVVGAYHYANAESDLATYRSQFGLPACTKTSGCLTVVNQNGKTSPLPSEPPSSDDWTLEMALDMQMVSAGCPKCKIVLVEADDNSGNGLFIGNNAAAAMGVTVISNSWGMSEQPSDPVTQYEDYFNHTGIGIFVSSGDDGYNDGGSGPDYPGTSYYVTAVGGTTLTKSTATQRGWVEGAWGTDSGSGAGGSACSLSITKPSWQGTTQCSHKATADISAVGNPNTGVAVYNKKNGGWVVIGGTSASSPFVAAVYALTGHGAAAPSFAYKNAGYYFDITSGKNGTCGNILCNAGAGWDGPTGMGSPNGSALNGGTTCTPNCSGKVCGDNGCGGSCGTCASGTTCNSSGVCTSSGGCAHAICSTGTKLTSGCNACVTAICAEDSYCCNTKWDSICVGEVSSVCNQSCCTPTCSGKVCGDDGCGGSCGTCASGTSCNSSGQCISTCTSNCSGKSCGDDGCGGSCGSCSGGATCNSSGACVGGGSCAHAICSTGAKLVSGCDPCVTAICAQDSYCCSTNWDSICVGKVSSICNQSCGGGGCAHAICSTGAKLTSGCDACVTKICAEDSYCCGTKWDSICVGEVASVCGQSC